MLPRYFSAGLLLSAVLGATGCTHSLCNKNPNPQPAIVSTTPVAPACASGGPAIAEPVPALPPGAIAAPPVTAPPYGR